MLILASQHSLVELFLKFQASAIETRTDVRHLDRLSVIRIDL